MVSPVNYQGHSNYSVQNTSSNGARGEVKVLSSTAGKVAKITLVALALLAIHSLCAA